MPELPEVEIVKRSLQKSVYLRKILKVKVNNRNLRYKVDKNFEKKLKGKKILNISRKAKYITISLDDYTFFCIHLGMSGTLHIVKNKFENKKTNLSFYHSPVLGKKHNHLIFYFKDFKIIYNDPRRFGFIKVFENKRTFNNYFSRNGCEPFSKNFNLEYLKKNLNLSKKSIKNVLLDQKIISGIGNIYASEILFHSKIRPIRLANSLNLKEISNIIISTKYILNKAIKKGGSSIRDFKNSDGNTGFFQNEFKVYNKENENCPNSSCKNKIKKLNISNRSTFYCNICQK